MQSSRIAIPAIVLLFRMVADRADAAEASEIELQRRFAGSVHPFLETYCFACHGKEKPKGQLDLSPYSSMDAVVKDFRRWEIVLEKLTAMEMPPEEAKRHPASELRQGVIDWIRALRRHEAKRNAGDPGPVLARRLSNAEYAYTVRDLTGVDIRPTKEFPVDPANEAGFDNSRESLSMSPALLKKHLEAARHVADHVVLKPHGLAFAPHPAVSETDRDKYCVKRIVNFYQRQPTDYAGYFLASWRFKNRAALGQPDATLADVAAENRISAKYLATIWVALTETPEEIGPLANLQAMWRELPKSEAKPSDLARRGCEQMRDLVVRLREQLKPEFKNLTLRGIANGSQPLALWKNRQYATNRMRYTGGIRQIPNDPKRPDEPRPNPTANNTQYGTKPASPSPSPPQKEERAGERRRLDTVQKTPLPASQGEGGRQSASPIDSFEESAGQALVIPTEEAARARYEAALERFCRIFPDAFYVSERGRVFLQKDEGDRGRLLSAGFHLMVGYFRDDAPLCELILDEQGQREIDALWQELNFITFAPMRQYKDYIFFERAEPPRFAQGAEFDFARSEDKDATSEAKIHRLAEAYLAKARQVGGDGPAIDAIACYFKNISEEIRWVERARRAAEPSHLESLLAFAGHAYRRPLSRARSSSPNETVTSSPRNERQIDHLVPGHRRRGERHRRLNASHV